MSELSRPICINRFWLICFWEWSSLILALCDNMITVVKNIHWVSIARETLWHVRIEGCIMEFMMGNWMEKGQNLLIGSRMLLIYVSRKSLDGPWLKRNFSLKVTPSISIRKLSFPHFLGYLWSKCVSPSIHRTFARLLTQFLFGSRFKKHSRHKF